MSEQNRCPQCSKPLPSGSPHDLCPACLLACGLEANTVDYTGAAPAGAKWAPPPVEHLAPLFPELDVLELIGRGGMGAVYKARQKNLDRIVALKILPPEIGQQAQFADRFAREAQAMARLTHPNIVAIYDFGCRGELYFFLMEYVDGLSLRQLLDAGTGGGAPKANPKEALAIVPQICDALQYAHDRGIVHRDIKPENILLSRAGQVKIADFGLAKLVGRDVGDGTGALPLSPRGRGQDEGVQQPTQAGEAVMGTPQYMAPEQRDHPGEVDHRADIYSLGVVFYQMLTGELPQGSFVPPSRKVLIDVRLDEVVLRALEREPARRYQQVSEVRTQVETIVGSTPGGGPPSPAPIGADASLLAHARQAVMTPAIGLIVAAAINVALFAVLIPMVNNSDGRSVEAWWPSLIVLLSVVILIGAVRMMQLRNRGLCITAAILAWLAVPGNLIGLPFGIWSLVVLSRRETIAAFAAEKTLAESGHPAWHRWGAVVGTRGGKAVVNWPGVIVFASIALGIFLVFGAVYHRVVGGSVGPRDLLIPAVIVIFSILGPIYFGLTGKFVPALGLVPLDGPTWPRWAGAFSVASVVCLLVSMLLGGIPDRNEHQGIVRIAPSMIAVVAFLIAAIGYARSGGRRRRILGLVGLVCFVVCMTQLWAPRLLSHNPPAATQRSDALGPLEKLVQACQEQHKQAKGRYELGLLAREDVCEAEIKLLDARIRLADAQGEKIVPRDEVVGMLDKIVRLRQEQSEITKAKYDVGKAGEDAILEAQKKLAEARIASDQRRGAASQSASQPAQVLDIRGRVISRSGSTPIGWAMIGDGTHLPGPDSGTRPTRTDSDGYFRLRASSDGHAVTISAQGYEPQTVTTSYFASPPSYRVDANGCIYFVLEPVTQAGASKFFRAGDEILAGLPPEALPDPNTGWDEFSTPKADRWMRDNVSEHGFGIAMEAVVNTVKITRITPKDKPEETLRWDVAVRLEPIGFTLHGAAAVLKVDNYSPDIVGTNIDTFVFNIGGDSGLVTVSGEEAFARRAKEVHKGDRITVRGMISKAAVWPTTLSTSPPTVWLLLYDANVALPGDANSPAASAPAKTRGPGSD